MSGIRRLRQSDGDGRARISHPIYTIYRAHPRTAGCRQSGCERHVMRLQCGLWSSAYLTVCYNVVNKKESISYIKKLDGSPMGGGRSPISPPPLGYASGTELKKRTSVRHTKFSKIVNINGLGVDVSTSSSSRMRVMNHNCRQPLNSVFIRRV